MGSGVSAQKYDYLMKIKNERLREAAREAKKAVQMQEEIEEVKACDMRIFLILHGLPGHTNAKPAHDNTRTCEETALTQTRLGIILLACFDTLVFVIYFCWLQQ